jgi:ribosomal protein L19E
LVETSETLSEGKATLDSVGGKKRNTVKRQGNFGQSWQKKEKHCQKVRQLRTELAETRETLSEGKATSDRVGGKKRNTVKR